MNKVILAGNLGSDAELKHFEGSGNSVLNFSVATTEKWKDRDGNKKEKTNWHRCQLNGKRAEALAQYLTKGTKVLVTGSVQYREFEKDGQKRLATDIRVDDVEFLGGGKRQDGDSADAAPTPRTAAAQADYYPADLGGDEIPF